MLPKAQYESIADLEAAAKKSYPKRLQDKQISLKYADEEGDWLYLSEDEDLNALGEFASKLDNKKIKLVVEVKKADQTQNMEVDQVNQAMADVSLEEEKQVKFEDLKDFKIADVASKIEAILNSEEKFGKWKIWKTILESAEGTKAEHHIQRLQKQLRGCKKHGRRGKMFRRFFSKSASKDRSSSSSIEKHGHPGFEGPMGPMGPFGAPHYGPHGGFGPHLGGKRARKFFKKFMKSYRSSSSDGSSEERREKRRARKEARKCEKKNNGPVRKLDFDLQNESIVGKAGEQVNFTVNIKDVAPHPIWLTGAKKVSGESVTFEDQPFEEAKVFREKEHEVELTATLPAEAGEYPVTLGFLNKKGNVVPGHLALNFRAE